MPIVKKRYLLLIGAYLIGSTTVATSQSTFADTVSIHNSASRIIAVYKDSLKQNLRIYDGYEFTGGYRRSAGHPFFEFDQPQPGTILYEGTEYSNVLLAYDLSRDEVITVNPVSNQNIKLITSKIGRFQIGDHSFISLSDESGSTGFPGEGFYELLYDNDVSVLAKRKKWLRESARAEESSRFLQSATYFIKKDNTFHEISSKRSLLRLIDDKKAEAAKFMQKEKLDFKKDPEQTIMRVMEFYNLLEK